MGQVVKFPHKYRDPPHNDQLRFRSLVALRMLFDDIRCGRALPTKLMFVYNDQDSTLRYLNLGYTPDEIVQAAEQVKAHQKQFPD